MYEVWQYTTLIGHYLDQHDGATGWFIYEYTNDLESAIFVARELWCRHGIKSKVRDNQELNGRMLIAIYPI